MCRIVAVSQPNKSTYYRITTLVDLTEEDIDPNLVLPPPSEGVFPPGESPNRFWRGKIVTLRHEFPLDTQPTAETMVPQLVSFFLVFHFLHLWLTPVLFHLSHSGAARMRSCEWNQRLRWSHSD